MRVSSDKPDRGADYVANFELIGRELAGFRFSHGLSYLTQPGGLLSNLPAPISASTLESASPQDLVSLSDAALQAQEVDGLFGISSSSQVALPGLTPASTASSTTTNELPGVSSADLANATPQQQASLDNQATLLQQVQTLFGIPASTAGTTDLLS